jgi:hypothetical protein
MWEYIANLLECPFEAYCFDSTIVEKCFFACPIIPFLRSTVTNAGKKGSKYSKPRAVSAEKQAKQLTDEQKEILVGTMLGDAYLERAKPTHNALYNLYKHFQVMRNT